MTRKSIGVDGDLVQRLFSDPRKLREVLEVICQAAMGQEVSAHPGAERHERSDDRQPGQLRPIDRRSAAGGARTVAERSDPGVEHGSGVSKRCLACRGSGLRPSPRHARRRSIRARR